MAAAIATQKNYFMTNTYAYSQQKNPNARTQQIFVTV